MAATEYTIEQLKQAIGHEVAVSEWLAVSQEMIDQFAETTLDRQWIHVDRGLAAAESPYGTTISHGFLTLSLLSHLSREAAEVKGEFRMRINYGLNRVRFPSAVPAGSRVRAHLAPQSVDDFDGGHQVTWLVTVELEGGAKPALAAEWIVRLYK